MRIPKTKSSSAKSVSGPKRSCQERTQPDATTPKAMKDPNWRTRQDTGSSTDIENIMPPMEQFNSKLYPPVAQLQSSHTSQHERGSFDFSIMDKYSSESSSASEGFVKILRKIDLRPIGGRQMSIFELDVRPETPTPTIASDDRRYVKVARHVSGHQRDSSSATEITASSHDTENVHSRDLFQVVTLDRLCRQSASASSSHAHLHESRNIYEKGKNTPSSFESNATISRDRPSKDELLRSPQTAIRNNRDQAFQRLIQRLNRDNHSNGPQSSQSPTKAQAKNKQPQPELMNKVFNNFRRPMAGDGRRNQTISDFKVDYWGNCQSSVASRDGSENTVQASSKQNTWNPKAREFYSLNRRPIPWDTGATDSREKALPNFNSWPQSNSTKTNTPPFNPYLYSQDQATSTIPSYPVYPSATPLAPAFNLGQCPQTFGNTPYLPGNPATQPSLFPLAPLPGLQSPAMPFGNLTAQQIAAQQIAALPYLASLASLSQIPLLTGLEKPNLPVNNRRPPVPKPTLPNAGAQLAYEEWIEWRKANEPGYAVECKARQQRRSQRCKGIIKEGGSDKPAEPRIAQANAVAAA
ncbi:hypothetical protein ISF_06896 [Cordyceps fumosorosea ARSEF 2679]|uniref:Uncharacterized protein n=1 Tax=Cordyceps fumosorosea (strain ARSEF 2679) TaxID=1081104 RepID=A0A167QHS4_CORFA|nr:hypothetical protein ISF_06896 [Cordyceps fumosorosea ARSEF 2679]OAA57655.1 hypothetical protein ISF_06896 [Cordyceps fumosorosea ARSEF 2679]